MTLNWEKARMRDKLRHGRAHGVGLVLSQSVTSDDRIRIWHQQIDWDCLIIHLKSLSIIAFCRGHLKINSWHHFCWQSSQDGYYMQHWMWGGRRKMVKSARNIRILLLSPTILELTGTASGRSTREFLSFMQISDSTRRKREKMENSPSWNNFSISRWHAVHTPRS